MASKTSNLQLTIVSGSDLVNYEDLNTNFRNLDKLGIDYVAERGWKSPWWYRKWSSGRMECGVDNVRLASSTGMTPWVNLEGNGKLYYSNEFTFGNYPVSFTSRPYATCVINRTSLTNGANNQGSNIATFVIQRSVLGGVQSPPFLFVSTTGDTIYDIQGGIFCTGFWKNDPRA